MKFKKGNIPWNKDLKGIHLSPKSEFAKGRIPWHTGLTKETDKRVLKSSERIKSSWRKEKELGIRRRYKKLLEAKLCKCGCREYAKSGKDFIWGHNGRLFKHKESTKEVIKKSIKKMWDNYSEDERSSRIKKALTISKPNFKEIQLFNLVQSISSNYALNTKGEVIVIGGKIPDIVNINGEKKLVELFGKQWHKPEDDQKRINYFKQFGWNTLIVWENELRGSNLKDKIEQFIGG